MISLRGQKSKLRSLNIRRVDPLKEQVKKILGGTDQQLILMVRG